MTKAAKRRTARRKLRAHDTGQDRHSKSRSTLAKQERLTREHELRKQPLQPRGTGKRTRRSVVDRMRERLGLGSEWV